MGQKVNPVGFRLGVNETWRSSWYAEKNYKTNLINDIRIRDAVKKQFKNAGIDRILIARSAEHTKVQIHAAKTGVIIGKKGAEIDRLKKILEQYSDKPVSLDVVEVRKADLSAAIQAHGIAQQLEKRIAFRRAMRKAVVNALRGGAKGIKVRVSGRLAGSEIARAEWYREGRLRLHTLRSAIDYAQDEAHTTYGVIGVKVWIYTGERATYKTFG
ncbi:MAG: 30S ribosomal protein S3 [Pseudomonadota bacterium]